MESIKKKVEESFFSKVKRTVLLEDDEVLWKTEVAGNKLVAFVMVIMAGILLFILFLNSVGVFHVDNAYINDVVFHGLIELLIPCAICYAFKGERKWIKVLLLVFLLFVCARIDSILTINVPLLICIPTVLSTRYYNHKLTSIISILTVIIFGISCWYGCEHGVLALEAVELNTGETINVINNSLKKSILAHGYDFIRYRNHFLTQIYMPKLFCYILISVCCAIIAKAGRNNVISQDSQSRKTERLSTELSLASDIQSNMLPNIFPAFPEKDNFDIYAINSPAKEVGGDFYDFFLIDKTHLAIIMADVSGKGVPAALFMVIAKTLIKDHTQLGLSPAEVFTRVNNLLCEGNEAGLFVTAWMGTIDLNTNVLTYVNAGHNPPLYRHKGKYQYLQCKPGFVLAGMEDLKYKQYELNIEVGDSIFLYTDGVTESTDINGEQYGESRLLNLINEKSSLPPKQRIEAIRDELAKFAKGAEQFDDVTMLCIDYMKAGDGREMISKTFDANVSELSNVLEFVESQLVVHKASMKVMMPISVAVEEMFVNVASYAYEGKEPGDCTVDLIFDGDDILIRLTDSGMEFDPVAKSDPDVTLSAEERGIGGLGIFMVKKSMDSLAYERVDGCNVLTMKKKILNV